ncbi:MAG: metalloprotease TldD, partial [Gammaproteobacteria bacterium]|nr:metalloprotease TldD [Gammaproteobacteria bacterium]
MSQSTTLARQTLLDTPGLSEGQLGRLMDRLLSRQVDAADIYFQYARLESWVLDDGIIKEGSHSIEQGAGLRAISGDKTGFAYTDSLELSRLLDAAGAARAIAQAGQHGALAVAGQSLPTPLYAPINPLESL